MPTSTRLWMHTRTSGTNPGQNIAHSAQHLHIQQAAQASPTNKQKQHRSHYKFALQEKPPFVLRETCASGGCKAERKRQHKDGDHELHRTPSKHTVQPSRQAAQQSTQPQHTATAHTTSQHIAGHPKAAELTAELKKAMQALQEWAAKFKD